MSRQIIPPGIVGANRTMVTPHYAVMPPAGILPSRLPFWRGAAVHVHTSPAMGARFTQALLRLAPGGGTEAARADGLEHFLYLTEGAANVAVAGRQERLTPGGFAFIPAGTPYALDAPEGAALIWIRKPFVPVPGLAAPEPRFGTRAATPRVNKHTAGRHWQALLGEADLRMDMEVNILSFAPGTHFPFVETHVMEHGLYMLEGQGLYLLGREWHECWAGDFIWMGPYVPQQFYATGWGETSYLLYKDVNRDVAF